jgi:hypothetical protein
MAGERRGQGIRGRLNVYGGGKALVSGLGEAVMDRALADVRWLKERLADVEEGRPLRAKVWGQAALTPANLHVCWALTKDRRSALELGPMLSNSHRVAAFAPDHPRVTRD